MNKPTPEEAEGSSNTIIIDDQPAPIWARFLAALVDLFSAVLLSSLFFSFVLIYLHPEVYQLIERLSQIVLDPETGLAAFEKIILEDDDAISAWLVIQFSILGVFFSYFFFSELWFRGSSMGKLMFRLTVVSSNTHEQAGIATTFLRCWLKTLFLLTSPLLLLTFLPIFIRKDHRSLHDILTRTQVLG